MKLRHSGEIVVTPERALQLLEAYPYMRQRDLREMTVREYADLMKSGEFQELSDLEVAWAPNGDGNFHGYLINGQHRLNAIVSAGATYRFFIKEIECESMEEVNMRYAVIDTQKRRNHDDLNRALGLSEELSLKEYQLGWLASACLFIDNDFRRSGSRAISLRHLVDMEVKYAAAGSIYFSYLHRGQRVLTAQMRRQGIMAVGLACIDEARAIYGHEKVGDFFMGIAHDDGLVQGDPRKLAVKHLQEVAQGKGDKGTRIQQEYSARFLALCWNAWIEERMLKMTRVLDPRRAIDIMGTHWRG